MPEVASERRDFCRLVTALRHLVTPFGVCLRLVDPGLALVLGQADDRAVPSLDHLLEVTRVAMAKFLDRVRAPMLFRASRHILGRCL